MRPKHVALVGVMALVLILVGWAFFERTVVRETLFSEAPMEAYLAEQIVLEPQIGASTLPPEAGLSSAGWVAVVEMLGTEPDAPRGCDIHVRYFAGHPGVGAEPDVPAAAQAGYAVVRVKDPDEPSGPVSFRFPRDGSLWAADMQRLMPEEYWRDAKPDSFADLEAAWRLKARAE